MAERPRERLLEVGAQGLSDAQLLAIILRTGGGGKSALDLALELLDSFGSLQAIADASNGEFVQFKGLGSAKTAQVKAAMELGSRLSRTPQGKGQVFATAEDIYLFYHHRFRGAKREEFHSVLLDAKNRLLRECRISVGTLTNSLIHPREAFREAIKEAAAAVIFSHNHPSGDPTPSREDRVITKRLVEAGEIIGIRVLDHVIIGNGGYVSMMEKGYLR